MKRITDENENLQAIFEKWNELNAYKAMCKSSL